MFRDRIDKVISRIESKIEEIPKDERVPDNPDYMKWEKLLQGFKKFKESVTKIEQLITEIGV